MLGVLFIFLFVFRLVLVFIIIRLFYSVVDVVFFG